MDAKFSPKKRNHNTRESHLFDTASPGNLTMYHGIGVPDKNRSMPRVDELEKYFRLLAIFDIMIGLLRVIK